MADNLKTTLAPILPRTAQKLHGYLGDEGQLFGTQQVVEDQEEARRKPGTRRTRDGRVGRRVRARQHSDPG